MKFHYNSLKFYLVSQESLEESTSSSHVWWGRNTPFFYSKVSRESNRLSCRQVEIETTIPLFDKCPKIFVDRG